MIPKLRFPEFKSDWTTVKVEEEYLFKNGLNKEKEFFGRGFSIVNFTDVYHNPILSMSQCKGLVDVNESEKDRFKVSYGDIMFTRTSETIHDIGMSSAIVDEEVNAVFSGFVLRATPQRNNLTPHYAGYLFRSPSVRKEIVRKSSFTTRALTSGTSLSAVFISYPSNLEQVKIASLLHLIDQKINLITKKKEALETYKKGLMQKIFSQELRFKREDGTDYPEWESLSFSAVFDRVKRKNKNGLETVLTISAQLGLVDPTEYFSRDVSSSDKSNYTLLHRNEFAYNKSYSKGYPLGAIKRNTRYNVGVLSPLYICFACKNEAFVEYYEHYFESGIFNKQIYRIAQEGARNHGLLNVSVTEFFEDTILKHPSKEESQKISDILTKFDALITSVSEKLVAAEQLKKGLLQQMFV